MTLSPQITLRHMEPDEKLQAAIQAEIKKLETFEPAMTSCRVALDGPQRTHGLYKVRIDAVVPGKELVVKHAPTLHNILAGTEAQHKTKRSEPKRTHRDALRAIKEAFAEMRRQIQDHRRKLQGKVKLHEPARVARVKRLFPEMDYGYLETMDGRELYFHRNAVLDGHYEHLRVGSEVDFAEEPGEQGPQASTVRLVHTSRQLRTAAKVKPLPLAKARPQRNPKQFPTR